MKKLFLIVCGMIISCATTYSQYDNQAEAKAAYLLAEEAYNAGRFELAIGYLNKSAEKLGAANAKILYLRVLAEAELTKQFRSYLPKVIETAKAFLSTPDVHLFPEEKVLEVSKIKLRLEKEALAELENQRKEKYADSAFMKFSTEGWTLGMPVAACEALDSAFFKLSKREIMSDNIRYMGKDVKFRFQQLNKKQEQVRIVQFKENKLVYYSKVWVFESGDNTTNKKIDLISRLREGILFEPKVSSTRNTSVQPGSFSGNWYKEEVITTYTWERANKRVQIIETQLNLYNRGVAQKGYDDAKVELIMQELN